MGALGLEIVTPTGVSVRRFGVDKIVVRRREPRFEYGSEIVILPRHAPTLIRISDHDLRYVEHDTVHVVGVASGFAEVLDDRVTVVTPSAEPRS